MSVERRPAEWPSKLAAPRTAVLPSCHACELTDESDRQFRIRSNEILEPIGRDHQEHDRFEGHRGGRMSCLTEESDLAEQLALPEAPQEALLSVDTALHLDRALVHQVDLSSGELALTKDHVSRLEHPDENL